MRKQLQRVAIILAAVLSCGVLNVALAGAQSTASGAGNGFRISPVRAEYTIEKGKSETLTINLENPADVQISAHAVVNDFVASDDESGEPRLILDEQNTQLPKNDFKKLVSGLSDVTLAPQERRDINVTISVPADANAGGYYGAIRFVPILPSIGTENVGLTASVGTIVLIRVPGNLTERLDLVQLAAANKVTENKVDVYKPRSFFTSGDVTIMTRLKNSGDIHLQPFGKVQIKDMFGKVVDEYEFNNTEQRANVLPDSTRKFTDTLPKKKWFGRYTVEANLGYSQGGGDLITAKATFWYIPTLALYGFIVLILAIVGAVYWFIRRSKARKQHKHDVNKKKI